MVKLATLVVEILFLSSYLCEAAKILVVYPLPARSHTKLGEAVCRNLLKAGHEVTFITPSVPKKDENLRIIDVSDNYKLYDMWGLKVDMKAIMDNKLNMDDPFMLTEMMEEVIRLTLKNKNVDALLSDPNEQFDLVVMEWMLVEVYVGIPVLFNCPYVWVSTVGPHWFLLRLIDDVTNPAYTPDGLSSNFPPLTFAQRVLELCFFLVGAIVKDIYFGNYELKLYEEFFAPLAIKRGVLLTPYQVAKNNASLVFGISHVSFGEAYTLPQSYVHIGGIHIDQELEPLPKDLQNIMDNGTNGVIYFSMGSVLKSNDLETKLKKELLNMFGALKQTVLWKFEEILADLPSNVHIVQWAPQHTVLSHRNCVLFITHGGILSTIESISAGVPTIGIPVYGDQFVNVNRMVHKGTGRKIDLSYNMTADLKLAIDEILSNNSYSIRAKELSQIYHDRPVPPGKELVHWVEHVVRTRGALHLRSPALHVPWYQKVYLDLAIVVIVVLYVIKTGIKLIWSLKGSSQKKKTE